MLRITKTTSWLISIHVNEVAWGSISREKYHSVRNIISRFNSGRGYDRGVFYHHQWDYVNEIIVVVCESLEEYKQNCDNGNKEAWRKKIPSVLD